MSVPQTWQPSQQQQERDAYRRSRTRRSLLNAALVTVVVAAAIVFFVGRSTGWPRFRDSFLDVHAGWSDVPDQLRHLWINVQIMLITEVLVLVLAAVIAVLRTLRGPAFLPVRVLATVYVDVFRGLPVLVVLFIVGFGVPSLRLAGAPTSPFVLAIIALTLTYTAYVAEVLRAGIESVHPSQRASARALGLSYAQSMRHVVFPQAVRRVLPALLNDFVSLQKDTSLVSFLGVVEVVLTATNQTADNFKFVSYVVAGLVFLALTVPLTRLTDWISRRQGWIGTGGAVL